MKADGSQIAEPVRPHFLSGSESDERLRSATILLPVILVLAANRMDQRKPGVPLMRALGLRQTGKIWHECAIGKGKHHRHDGAHAEMIRSLDQSRPGVSHEICQRNL